MSWVAPICHAPVPHLAPVKPWTKPLGDQLLVPRGRLVDLTPRAVSLIEPVRQLVSELEQLIGPGSAGFDPRTSTRSFALSATELFQSMLLPSLLQRTARSAPAVHIAASSLQGQLLGEQLEAGELDVAVTSLVGVGASRGLRVRVLLTDRFVCVLRRGHPAAGRLTLDAFAGLEHIAVSPRGGPGGPLDTLLAARKAARRVVATTTSFFAAAEVVARTDLACILPAKFLSGPVGQTGLVVLAPAVALPPIRLGLLWHARFDRDAGHRWLREQIAQASKEF